MKTAVDLLESLKTFVVDQRKQYENFEGAALRIDGVEQEFRHGKGKKKSHWFAYQTRINDVSEDTSVREKI